MKNKGFGHLKTRLFAIKTSINMYVLGAHGTPYSIPMPLQGRDANVELSGLFQEFLVDSIMVGNIRRLISSVQVIKNTVIKRYLC